MKILLTGGCGYVGTRLTEALLERGYEVDVVDAQWFGNKLPEHKNLRIFKIDVRDHDDVPFDNVDVVMHLANVANDPCVELDPKLSWEVNALGTMKLADNAVRAGVKQFIFASSGSVYGVSDEPQVTEELKLEPISEYNKTKMVAERVLLSYGDKMIIQCVRPGTVCGFSPRMRLDLAVNMLTIQAVKNGEITVFGGDQIRPAIHIDDMIKVYLHMLDNGSRLSGVFNASHENISIKDLAETIAARTGAKITIKESDDPRSYRMNSDKLIGTGFVFSKTVSDAISEVAQAYKDGDIVDEDNCYNVKWMKKTICKV